MIERYFEIEHLNGVGLDEEDGRVLIFGKSSENEEIQLSIPAIDLPELILLLSRSFAMMQVSEGETDLIYTQPVSDVQAPCRLKGGDFALIVTMKSGVSVPFSIPHSVGIGLRDQLDSLL